MGEALEHDVASFPQAIPVEKTGLHGAPASEKKGHAVLVMMLAGMGILCIALQSAATAYDNDMWWLLATGREILQNGIPYTNPFTYFDNMGVVFQQWLASVIAFVIYDASGITGIQVLVFLQQVILTALLFALCAVCRGKKGTGGEIAALLILMGFGAFQAYSSVRPHLYTMIMFAALLLVLELYRRNGKLIFLVLLPVLVCIHVNLHASMAPYDLFIIALYLIPDVPSLLRNRDWNVGPFFFHGSSYKRIPLLVAFLVSGLALAANPYGLDGALYLVNSYSAADYGNYINEMGSTDMMADYGIAAMVSIVVGSIALGVNGEKNINVPLSLLFLVAIPLSIMHTRNVWLVAFFAVPLAAQAFSGYSLWIKQLAPLRSVAFRALAALVVCAGVGYFAYTEVLPKASEPYETDSGSVPVSGMDYLDRYCQEQGLEKTSLKLYNSFNNGGYVEWRGYRAFIDPRPELWEPAITGINRHYYQEFVDFAQSKTTTRELLEQYDFDFMIVYSDCTLATDLEKRTDYEVVHYGSGYRVWKRVF